MVEVIVRCKPAVDETAIWRISDEQTLECDSTEEYKVDIAAISDGAVGHEEFYAKHISKWTVMASRGYNVTILAHGLPNSGKTYSMMGTTGQSRLKPEARGMIVRCFNDLVGLLQGTGKASRITGSYCHVFDDSRVADLLDTKKRNLPVVESDDRSTYYINGCTQQVLTTTSDVVRIIEKAHLMRNATGVVQQRDQGKKLPIRLPTANNTTTTTVGGGIYTYRAHKSHAIFQYTIEHIGNINEDNSNTIVSTITIIDLAGHNILTYFGEESDCSDEGLKALHDILQRLSNDEDTNNNDIILSLCKSTALTRLLYSSLFSNSKCVVISTLPMCSTDAKRQLQLALSFKNSKNSSVPCIVPTTSTKIGKTISEMKAIKMSLIGKCTPSDDPSALSLEILNSCSINIGSTVYDNHDEESLELLQKYFDLKNSLLINENAQFMSTQ